MMQNIIFYYHHFGGLGHGMRIYSLCKAIKNLSDDYKLLVVNSGVPQPELNIEKYAKVINLPYFKSAKDLFSGLYSPYGLEDTFKKRKEILSLIADRTKFQVAIFEHFPFGRGSLEKEIVEFINMLQGKNTLVYSSVRDIILQRISSDRLKKRIALFNAIFIHSDTKMGFMTNFRQPKMLMTKNIFTGRVLPETEKEWIKKERIRKKLKCGNKKLIVISIGGGIDGFEIIERMIKIKTIIDKEFKTLYLISTGCSIEQYYFAKLIDSLRHRNDILINKFTPRFLSYINASDLYISMGGYNSVNNALVTGVRTVIFSRKYDNEQKLRVRYFKEYLDLGDIESSSDDLASKIINVLSLPKKNYQFRSKFNGAEITAKLIERILNLSYIKIRLTTRCNLYCDMCSVKHQKYELDFTRLKQIIDQAKLLNVRTINFSGGEPSLYQHFYKLIKYVKSQGFFLSISSNGIMENRDVVRLSKSVNFLDTSIHSHKEEIDDKIKGRHGAFRKTIGFVRILAGSNENIKLHINVTVRPDNFKDIHQLVPLLSKYIFSISFTLVDTSINKLKYLKFSKDQLDFFYFYEVPLIFKKCMESNIRCRITPFFKDLKNMSSGEILRRLLRNKEYYLSRFFSIFEPGPPQLCPRAINQLRINADGNICPCCYLDDYPINLGNIYKNNLTDIVASEKYYNFVTQAKQNIGWCRKCHFGYKIYSSFFNPR